MSAIQMRSWSAVFLTLLSLTACYRSSATPPVSNLAGTDGIRSARVPSAPAYLYVGSNAVSRYQMHAGLPETTPDLTIEGAGGPVAASPLNAKTAALYAYLANGNIGKFASGATSPSRQIVLPSLRGQATWTPIGLAVDSDGYLYVGLQQFFSTHHSDRREPVWTPFQVVYIYGPDAHGPAKPVRIITQMKGNFESFGLDESGALYLMGETNLFVGTCVIVADARTNPHFAGQFTSTDLGETFGATVWGGRVYVSTFVPNPYRFELSEFPVSSRGAVKPAVVFQAASGSIIGGPVHSASALFVGASYPTDTVWFFHGATSGMEKPFGNLSVSNYIGGISIGQ